jgi:hypothetical protein
MPRIDSEAVALRILGTLDLALLIRPAMKSGARLTILKLSVL